MFFFHPHDQIIRLKKAVHNKKWPSPFIIDRIEGERESARNNSVWQTKNAQMNWRCLTQNTDKRHLINDHETMKKKTKNRTNKIIITTQSANSLLIRMHCFYLFGGFSSNVFGPTLYFAQATTKTKKKDDNFVFDPHN